MGRIFDPDDFIIQYPGVYEGAAKVAMDKYFADADTINNTTVTGEDIVAGRVKAPVLGDVLHVTANMMRFGAAKYAPDYALLQDEACARAHGYDDIFAMIGFSACDDVYTIPSPPETRDTLLVSQICHEIKALRPVYPGDTIYMIRDRFEVDDLTPQEGSVYRHLAQRTWGTTYNQRGEAVNKVYYSTMESLKTYKEGRNPKPKEQMGFMDMWEDPDWFSRPQHVYTDADYEYFKSLWKQSACRGDEPLYWEDIQIGDKPTPSVYGPIFEGVAPTKPFGMGVSGCRCLKDEILDPATFKTLVKDALTGIYQSTDPEVNVPATPDGVKALWLAPPDEEPAGGINTADIHQTAQTRSALINFMGRDIALGHIYNLIGYKGSIRSVRWSIMCPETHAALGKPVPKAKGYEVFTREVPGMEDSVMPIHGLTDDVAIVKSVVTDKYVRNNHYYAAIVFWNEDIEGRSWITGKVEVELPSRKA